jgi:uncharacterized membrane protein YebE (DUF533 family)
MIDKDANSPKYLKNKIIIMKIQSFIWISVMFLTMQSTSSQAQSSRKDHHNSDRKEQSCHKSKDQRKDKIKKYKKMHNRSLYRVAKADGKISKRERRQMRREVIK